MPNDTKQKQPEGVKFADQKSSSKEQVQEGPPEDALVEVRVTNDRMNAYVQFTAPQNGGKSPSAVDVFKQLSLKQVTYGVKTEMVSQICEAAQYGQEIKIAEGRQPVKGADAKLRLKVRVGEKPKPREREDGSVDFSSMGLVTEVTRGQILCERVPPTEGTQGIDVLGRPVPAISGLDKPLPAGANTAIMDDGRQLVALVDGKADLVGDRINVSQNLEINGDVDVGTGDVTFKGNVTITGNITPGRKVEVTGNIEVFGMIEGGTVLAGGDITVRGGVVSGGHECFVQCQGSLNCRYVESVSVIAFKDIRAQMIMHSQIKCGNLIELFGSKAAIIGGECLCGGNIVIRNAGSPASVNTLLEVGKDPTLTLRESSLNEEIESLKTTLAGMKRLQEILEQLKNMNKLTEDKADALESIKITRPSLENKVQVIQKELEEIKKKLWSSTPVEIQVMGIAYPGVEIRIGQAKAILDAEIKCKRFCVQNDLIIAK